MPSRDRNTHVDRAELNSYGPSWYDVYIIMMELKKQFPDENVSITLHTNTAVDRTAGLLCKVTNESGTILGAKRFLDKGAESSKTAAGAVWGACTRAYHKLDRERYEKALEQVELDITTPVGGPPSSPDSIGD